MSRFPWIPTLNYLRRWAVYLLALVVLAAGVWATHWRMEAMDRETRDQLLSQAVALARTLEPERVKSFSFTPADQTNLVCQQLREQLVAYNRTAGLARIFCLALLDGQVVSGPGTDSDSRPDSTGASPDIAQAKPALLDLEMFRRGEPFTQGPSDQEPKGALRAFAPVQDPRNGRILMVVGVEMAGRELQARLRHQQLLPLLFTVVLIGVLLAGKLFIGWRARHQFENRSWLCHTEAVLTAAFGGVLTLAIALLMREHQQAVRRDLFVQMAEGQAALLKAAGSDIRSSLMVGMAKYLEDDRRILEDEFHYYVGSLVRDADVRAFQWVPCVTAHERELFEAQARNRGYSKFSIFEKNQQGERVPAAARKVYYPVFYSEPLAGNELSLGYDLGSDPVRRAGLENAEQSGLPTATDPLVLAQDGSAQKSILIYHPVHLREDLPRPGEERPRQPPVGFALAVVGCQAMLERALGYSGASVPVAFLDWYQVKQNQAPTLLGSWPESSTSAGEKPAALSPESLEHLGILRPYFAFGAAYALVVNAGPAFFKLHPARAAQITGAVGLVLTTIATALVGLMRGRQERLEEEVRLRTETLRASEESYRRQFSDSLAPMLLVDPANGLIVDANAAAAKFYMCDGEQLKLRKVTELNALPQATSGWGQDSVLNDAGGYFEFQHRRADGVVRDVEVYSTVILLGVRRLLHFIIHDTTERKRAEAKLQQSLSLLQATLESTTDGILVVDHLGRIRSYNERFVKLWNLPPEILASRDDQAALDYVLQQLKQPEEFTAKVRQLYDQPEADSFDVLDFIDGRVYERYSRPQFVNGAAIGRVWSFRDVTSRQQAQAELEQTHRQLVVASRRAGMAEVATSVLHNVGNVLNSVNVSASVLVRLLTQSKSERLTKAAALLQANEHDLAAFLTRDPKGRLLPGYLSQLAARLNTEQSGALKELQELLNNVEHIKRIVAMQQNYAKCAGVCETVNPADLVEDALKMNAENLARHQVELSRDYEQAVPMLSVDKHKALQILVNLVRNAEQACVESGRKPRRLALRVAHCERGVMIAVTDNGVGIPPENLTRVFSHGFTTRPEGHGFGLHSGALAAAELGGALLARSEGLGHGATFVLELPIKPA